MLFCWLLCIIPVCGFTASLSGLFQGYLEVCEKAATDEITFAHFKHDFRYRDILEHLDHITGYAYLEMICRNSPQWVALFDRFRLNDAIGQPVTVDYGPYGRFSPTTLRYIKVASDLHHLFGDLTGWHIVEIGVGVTWKPKALQTHIIQQ